MSSASDNTAAKRRCDKEIEAVAREKRVREIADGVKLAIWEMQMDSITVSKDGQ